MSHPYRSTYTLRQAEEELENLHVSISLEKQEAETEKQNRKRAEEQEIGYELSLIGFEKPKPW